MNKSLSLYNLGNDYQHLFSQLYDAETGEVDEVVDAQLSALSTDVQKKCVAVATWIKSMESEQREIEHLKNEILNREAAYKKEISKWHDYLKSNMERCKISEVKCPYFTLKIKKNPFSTEIFDESLLPSKFMVEREVVRIDKKADKNAIKEEVLRTGVQIPGACVQQKTQLQILTDKI
jgi:hypothetical protein